MTRTEVARALADYSLGLASGERQHLTEPRRFRRFDGADVLRLPDAIHAALCSCTAVAEDHPYVDVWVCSGCGLAVDQEAA